MPRSKTIPSGRTPSPRRPSRAATKSARRKRARDGDVGGELAPALLGGRIAVDGDQLALGADALGDQAGVAAAAEGAVDEGLPRAGVEDVDQLGGENGLVFLWAHTKGSPTAASVFATTACVVCVSPSQPPRLRPRRGSRRHRRPLRPFPSRRSAQRSALQISNQSSEPTITHGPSPRPACSISFFGSRMRPAESSESSKAPPWKWRRSIRPALAERVGLAEEALREVLVAAGREHPDGGVQPLGENDSISERRAEPRRDREAVLRVEIVLVLTEKRQVGPSRR